MDTFFTTLILLVLCSAAIAQIPATLVDHPQQIESKTKTKRNKKRKFKRKQTLVTDGISQSNFEMAGGLILVEGKLNGVAEKFVFDTGAPHIFLNSKNRNYKQSRSKIVGVGGNQKLGVRKNVVFDWAAGKVKEKRSFALDLSHIENAKRKKIGGLIGYDAVRGKELVIDYKAQKLYMVSKKNKTFFSGHEKVDRVFFKMSGHIPVVRIKFGKKTFYFGIDTGAEVNVIDSRLRKKIPKDLISVLNSTKVMGINEEKEDVSMLKISKTKVGKHEYEKMDFIFADLSSFQSSSGIELDGFLGYPFLKQANFSIDYRKNQLVRWQPRSPKKNLELVKVLEEVVH